MDLRFSPDGKTLATTSNKGHWASDCAITLWKSSKIGAENEPLKIAISAREIVDELHEKHGSYNEVLSKLKDYTDITEPIRRASLQIANARLWEDEK